MSATESVLYDAPGPRARRRGRIGTAVALVVIVGLIAIAVGRLAEQGQFSMELWGPLINPTTEEFPLVWELLGRGLLATLIAAGLAIIFSVIIGTALGTARIMSGRVVRSPIVGYIELFRGLPVVITIFYVYLVFSTTSLDISWLPGSDDLWIVVIGLTLYNSVIIAEILRAGVLSLPSGQGEAARAVGMTEGQAMRSVLLPQAFRTMLPALISQLVVILKDTSLAAVLAIYPELLRRGNIISLNLDNPIQTLFVVAVIFILVNYGLSKLAEWTERRLSRSRGESTAMERTEQASEINTGA